MNTRIFFATLSFYFMALASVAAATEKGNGNIVTKNIQVSEYTNITLGGSINYNGDWFGKLFDSKASTESPYFEYRQAVKASLKITMDENLFPFLVITSNGAELKIGTQPGKQINPSKMIIQGTSKDLNNLSMSSSIDFKMKERFTSEQLLIRVSGSGDISIKEPANITSLNIFISGSSDIDMANVSCDIFDVAISGSGDLQIKGKANSASYKISGSGDIDAINFKAQNAACHLSGSGDLGVYASAKLDISVSGSGDVMYKGDAKVKTKVSGSGDVCKSK